MDSKFSKYLSEARKKNIKIIAVQITFNGKVIYFNERIPLGDF